MPNSDSPPGRRAPLPELAQLIDGLASLRERVSGDELAREIDRLCNLARSVLAVLEATSSGSANKTTMPVQLGTWLRQCSLGLAAGTLQLRLELAEGLPPVTLDTAALERALRELFDAARISGAREVVVRARTASLSLAELPADIEAGDYLCIELTDDGADATRLTTDRGGAGASSTAAFGERSAAYTFSRALGGTLRQQSRRDVGTTVALYLPLSRIVRTATGTHRQLAQPRRILLVDDEPYARSAARRVLRSLGHEVLEAGGGPEACRIAERSGPLDLLLTDLNMPEMDGFELARELRHQQPMLPILYMCGYPPETIEDAPPDAQFIEKPFTYEDLIYKVGQALEVGHGPR